MNRRSFLTAGAKVAALVVAAPWVVHAENLMPLVVRPRVFVPRVLVQLGGYTIVQWVEGSTFHALELTPADLVQFPDDVGMVWATHIPNGLDNLKPWGTPKSPYRDDRGNLIAEPQIIQPGRAYTVADLLAGGHR